MKKLLALLAIMALVAPAMAITLTSGQVTPATYNVPVNITVADTVSMWAGDGATPAQEIDLTLNGNGISNVAAVDSTISHINNVGANITATVTGTLPDPIVTGGGINFFIFKTGTAADAIAALNVRDGNAYAQPNALVWNKSTLGTPQTFGSVGVATSIASQSVVYAADAPGETPLPGSYSLVVTWTIAAN